MKMRTLFILVSLLIHSSSRADEQIAKTQAEFKRHGVYGTLLGDPGINLFGVNYAYWTSPNIRLSIGVGTIFFASSVGVGLNYYLSDPDSRTRIYLGLGLNALKAEGFEDSALYGEIDDTVTYQNLKIGAEFGSSGGIFVGFHVGLYFIQSDVSDQSLVLNPIPSVSLGTYF